MGAPPVIRYDSYLSYVSTAHVTVTGRILRLVVRTVGNPAKIILNLGRRKSSSSGTSTDDFEDGQEDKKRLVLVIAARNHPDCLSYDAHLTTQFLSVRSGYKHVVPKRQSVGVELRACTYHNHRYDSSDNPITQSGEIVIVMTS
ncbi:uncharacterized protein BDR25DRAFT_357542 [Lindgomyces ingoldianus]|uniref:Uncharacterized protein n=1 Tax=Lindgomyces ingoldianus TaxID=673940 RepID=A0ACB6QP16_9PLEO|nr:uncharacterized protein BDR25DRAFT_357542 [Lindgomyces ingoldianus]KAF2468615.1 hypothetical protein BDR25DRAFT_357542 [Lindgomyces ingoldianus]